MSKLILLVVGAAWMAVLLPPIVRSRFDPGSSSSVSDFRRQLHTLQRTRVPTAQGPMRSMARPLAPSPRTAPMARPRYYEGEPLERRAGAPARRAPRPSAVDPTTGEPRHRRSHHVHERHHIAAEEAFMDPREVVRRRRTNVLYGLVATSALSFFLAVTTGSGPMLYLFMASFLILAGYCYVLVQLRNQEYARRAAAGRYTWR